MRVVCFTPFVELPSIGLLGFVHLIYAILSHCLQRTTIAENHVIGGMGKVTSSIRLPSSEIMGFCCQTFEV